ISGALFNAFAMPVDRHIPMMGYFLLSSIKSTAAAVTPSYFQLNVIATSACVVFAAEGVFGWFIYHFISSHAHWGDAIQIFMAVLFFCCMTFVFLPDPNFRLRPASGVAAGMLVSFISNPVDTWFPPFWRDFAIGFLITCIPPILVAFVKPRRLATLYAVCEP